MSRSLPYPGYSWQISQHEIAFEDDTILALLGAAQQFNGKERNFYNEPLNKFLAESGVLTENVRDSVPSPWRDYQQVLAELGLIESTRLNSRLTITPVGFEYLSGNMSFPEMLSHQILRYQYPNGQKNTSSPVGLQMCIKNNISVRPAAQILKVLSGILPSGIEYLTLDDVFEYILPNRNDNEWKLSVEELIASGHSVANTSGIAKRNLRAWIRILGKMSIFQVDSASSNISLADISTSGLTEAEHIADSALSMPAWTPGDASTISHRNWFTHFGSFGSGALLAPQSMSSKKSAYDYDEADSAGGTLSGSDISLVSFSEIDTSVSLDISAGGDVLLESMKRGLKRRAFAKSQHDNIVNNIGATYGKQGYNISHDRGSVDLYVEKSGVQPKIFEVKTTNEYNVAKQIRAALSQLLEYEYRIHVELGKNVDKNIVLSRDIGIDWRRDFCSSYGVNILSAKNFEPAK